MAPERIVLDVLKGQKRTPPPIWMMRQAGRYLPEYREMRKTAGSFLDLCYNPDFAVEVTLQPIRRFGFDASILFSDILVVPHALGRKLEFHEGRGPIMEPLDLAEVDRLDGQGFHEHLAPVYETVRRLRAELPAETTLLGFCGAPWTVATYMIAGHGTPDQAPARLAGFRQPAEMSRLLDLVAERSAEYLIRQIDAGADAVQIFDSWSGVLDEAAFETCCIEACAQDRRACSRRASRHADHRLSEGGRHALRHLSREDGRDGAGPRLVGPAQPGKAPPGSRSRSGQPRSAAASSRAVRPWTKESIASSRC